MKKKSISHDEALRQAYAADSMQAVIDLLDMRERCPLGAYEVTGLCRMENAGAWRTALSQERHNADI